MISFGPLPSRRLGKSLGINNIITPKTCSFGCVYCQVGGTVNKTIRRAGFFKPDYIYENVCRHLENISEQNHPDYLTFVSSGEPTLDINLGKSIVMLRDLGIRIAVITNSSLLYDKSVAEDLSMADWVSLKIDTVYPETWKIINNPSQDLKPEIHLDSIYHFARHYTGSLNTESMLVKGLNDSETELKSLADFVSEVNPATAYLAVPVRPPAEKWVKPPEPDILNWAWQIFNNCGINTELLTGFEGADTGFTGNIYEDILNITAVHPLREDSLKNLLENDNASFSIVESLINQKLIRASIYEGERYFIRDYHVGKVC